MPHPDARCQARRSRNELSLSICTRRHVSAASLGRRVKGTEARAVCTPWYVSSRRESYLEQHRVGGPGEGGSNDTRMSLGRPVHTCAPLHLFRDLSFQTALAIKFYVRCDLPRVDDTVNTIPHRLDFGWPRPRSAWEPCPQRRASAARPSLPYYKPDRKMSSHISLFSSCLPSRPLYINTLPTIPLSNLSLSPDSGSALRST